MKSKLPLLIILAGVLLLGVGGWQYAHMKYETHSTLKKAKAIIAQKKEALPEKPDSDQLKKEKEKLTITGDTIGILEIPRIKAELAIVEGTDPDDLEKGVGHYKGSYLPTDNGQIVLSGHRDTVFRHLGELEIGDKFKVTMPYGTYTYEITHTKIVKSDDTSIITLQHENEELIVTTCYPFRYVGNAPKRYIIYAKPISSN